MYKLIKNLISKGTYGILIILSIIITLFFYHIDLETFNTITSNLLTSTSSLLTLDAILISFINVKSWKRREDYMSQRDKFLILKALSFTSMLSLIFTTPLELSNDVICVIIYFSLVLSIIITNIMFSLYLLMSVLISVVNTD